MIVLDDFLGMGLNDSDLITEGSMAATSPEEKLDNR